MNFNVDVKPEKKNIPENRLHEAINDTNQREKLIITTVLSAASLSDKNLTF